MGKLSQMTGTVWHVEKMIRKEGDDRRHKTRCVYFNHKDQLCIYRAIRCPGSAHCKYYEEKEKNASHDKKVESVIEDRRNQSKISKSNAIHIGSVIQHVNKGFGIVKLVNGSNMQVRFESGVTVNLNIETCIKNDLIVVYDL